MVSITFNEELCKGCGLCVAACPEEIIVLAAQINSKGFHPATVTEQEKCKGCAMCARMCPDVVIEIKREVQ